MNSLLITSTNTNAWLVTSVAHMFRVQTVMGSNLIRSLAEVSLDWLPQKWIPSSSCSFMRKKLNAHQKMGKSWVKFYWPTFVCLGRKLSDVIIIPAVDFMTGLTTISAKRVLILSNWTRQLAPTFAKMWSSMLIIGVSPTPPEMRTTGLELSSFRTKVPQGIPTCWWSRCMKNNLRHTFKA